jgi:phosphatidylglycerophosphate synthase
MASVLIDYFDGYAARRYRQCYFFGDVFDWMVGISSSTPVYLWWANLDLTMTPIVFTLSFLEVLPMAIEIMPNSYKFAPIITGD